MKTLTALAIKFITCLVILYAILGLVFDMSIQSIILTTLVIGVISYIIGDLLLLPRTNNIVATAIDFGLAFTLIWSIFSFGNVDGNYRSLFWASLLGGLGVALGESLFHMFMYRFFFPSTPDVEEKASLPSFNYAMETSEEIHPENKNNKDK